MECGVWSVENIHLKKIMIIVGVPVMPSYSRRFDIRSIQGDVVLVHPGDLCVAFIPLYV